MDPGVDVLGIHAHGDVPVVLTRDGELVAAVEEERFRRVKRWAGFPMGQGEWRPYPSFPILLKAFLGNLRQNGEGGRCVRRAKSALPSAPGASQAR